MASTVLVRDVLWRVAVLLQDNAPQFQRWPEHELVDWLNDAQVAITKFLPAACSRVDAIKLAQGTRQSIELIAPSDCLPGNGITPTQPIYGTQLLDVIRNMGADGLTPGKAIRQVLGGRDVLDSGSPTWHTVAKSVVSNFIFNPLYPRYFYVTPGVLGQVWIEAAFTAQPLKVLNTGVVGSELYRIEGTSTAVISVADEHVDDLVNYIVARSQMKDAEWVDGNKAAAFAGMFTNSLNAKVAALTGTNPNLKRLPFAPEPLGQAA